MRSFRILGSHIEYEQAVKRLEEIANAPPGSPEAQERKELIHLFRAFESEIKALQNKNNKAAENDF